MEVEELKEWFLSKKRLLPWRENPNPYRIWVSEMMLQQTQVATVIPYFLKWMKLFPTIESLAESPIDKVLKAWEGLGYYSRARNLHEGAKYVIENFNGKIPSEKAQLEQIKGLGPYTIGAIQSFAFHKKVPAVDGNVIRVLARYYKVEDDITKSFTQKKLREIAESILPEDESWIVNEALIELGATVCQRKARCKECPLQEGCKAYAQGLVEKLPYKSKKISITRLYRSVAVISHENQFLVTRGQKGKVMSDLYEFPYFEIDANGIIPDELRKMVSERYKMKTSVVKELLSVNHSFTRYQVKLNPVRLKAQNRLDIENYAWKTISELKELPFSSGHKRILNLIEDVS